MLTDEYRYKIIKLIDANPHISQRQLAEQLGISLGKTNYCLKALVQVGLLKANNFKNSKNKLGYMYFLTPAGLEEKALVTKRFLQLKMNEYEVLKNEIEELKRDFYSVDSASSQDVVTK